jgi:hypothetical protein
MAFTREFFDGEFLSVAAADVRPTDVLLNPARHAAGESLAPVGVIDIFRPADPARACAGCGAGAGESCGWGCLSMAALDDYTGYAFADVD